MVEMRTLLVVMKRFGGHARGDVTPAPSEVAETLTGPHAACVVRVVAVCESGHAAG